MYKSNINLNLYKTFYDVAIAGSISKAANATYTSQPAISKSIKNLESELGIKLFYRDKNGVILTDKGKELLHYIEMAYNNLLIAERSMIESDNLEKGKLSIGMPSNIGSFFLFEKIYDFHKSYPNIEVTIITGSTSKLLSLLEEHKIDFVVDTSPIDINRYSNYTVKELDRVNYCFVVKKNSKTNYKINSLNNLTSYPLILPIPGTANRNDLDILLNKKNIQTNNVLNLHTSEMIISAVKKDLGIGYVIYNLIEDDLKNDILELIDINDELPTATINIVFNKRYLTTAPKYFIKNYISNNLDLEL